MRSVARMESFEPRRHFALEPTIVLSGTGTLFVVGIDEAETISVKPSKNGKRMIVTVERYDIFGHGLATANFAKSTVKRINVDGKGGNDVISVGKLYDWNRSTMVAGGFGEDRIYVETAGGVTVDTGQGQSNEVYVRYGTRVDVRKTIDPAKAVNQYQATYSTLPQLIVYGGAGNDLVSAGPKVIFFGSGGTDRLLVDFRQYAGQRTQDQLVAVGMELARRSSPYGDPIEGVIVGGAATG